MINERFGSLARRFVTYLQMAETKVQRLEKSLSKHIAKTRPYFEQKDVFNKALESQKLRVHDLQQKVGYAKHKK